MTQHDYEATLECFNSGYEGDPDFLEHTHGDSIRHALRIAKKLHEEPSEGMSHVCNRLRIVSRIPGDEKYEPLQNMIFKAMRDQMLKELK